jgi:hypothetical protein
MASRKFPALLALAGVVVAVVLFIVLRDADSSDDGGTTTTTTTPTAQQPADEQPADQEPAGPSVPVIEIQNGQPVGGVQEIEVAKGDDIRFIVDSDVDEEVHLHGYDIAKGVTAGGKVEFDVPATIEGVFEVELEHSVVPIAEITVTPS